MNSVPFSFLPSVGDLTPMSVNVSRTLVANMGDIDVEDDEESQIHLDPNISIKEHLKKDKILIKEKGMLEFF
ncbi:unnamed protein product [Lactuca virosa]|uniref:Uncharacterized protein n=1 Tax=Lactuca virosa TaxID=75947 RepID=A0AAU9M7N3_9ASTR|nr:unnamed protein product [Lactuca virosa]